MSTQQRVYELLIVVNGMDPVNASMLNWESAKGRDTCVMFNSWNGYELGGVMRGAEMFDEFVHIMDSCVVHDYRMFHYMFAFPVSVHLCPKFYSYLGKYKTEVLKRIGIPKITTKDDAIKHEHHWHQQYLAADPSSIQLEPIMPITTNTFEKKHGRMNMVLSNGYMTKYKGTWM